MARAINLRQIETFRAFVENGTVSRAAEIVSISQPAASKLLQHLEEDSGLQLFDRVKGRLSPTAQGLRLYQEIERIFAGVRQVESAIEIVRRETLGRLTIGIVPALESTPIERATMNFLERNPSVYCSIQSAHSRFITDSILDRKIDVGIITSRIDNPALLTEPLLEHPLVCIMPIDHELAELDVIRPEHLHELAFVSYNLDSYTWQRVSSLATLYDVSPNVVLSANASSSVRQFVAAGLGVSLVHPLIIAGMEDRIIARPFEPATPFGFLICYARDARNSPLIVDFVRATKAIAPLIAEALA